MADCGASGSALDRAARAVLGGTEVGGASSAVASGDVAKHVASFMGHQHTVSAPVATRPAAVPDHLVLPSHQDASFATAAPAPAMNSTTLPPPHMVNDMMHPFQHQHAQQFGGVPMMGPVNPMAQHHRQQQLHQHHMMQQHQQHMAAQQHQQMMAMMHHQQQNMAAAMMMQQEQQRHQQEIKMKEARRRQEKLAKQQASRQEQKHTETTAVGDDGKIMDQEAAAPATRDAEAAAKDAELRRLLERLQNQDEDDCLTVLEQAAGHEGIVQGATIEELAAAWAEAEADTDATAAEDLGHEGAARGATMEELAAAWAEAEAEYEREREEMRQKAAATTSDADVDAAVNMWSGAADVLDPLHSNTASSYDFINKDGMPKDEMMKDMDWMGEGMRHFNSGNMKEAIRAFEMELQHQNPDNATAWRMLGRCHAENDQDREAIVCLEQAVDRDPYSPEALLALGVSYVNELNHPKALENLKAWITHNPKFAGLELDEDLYGGQTGGDGAAAHDGMESAFDEVQRLLLRALEFDPTDAADVLEALGVVYNVSRDYDAAIDSFEKALAVRPDDYQLWNKLGATLANGHHSDKALPAYHKALEIKPKYARAWLNMAISHSNLYDYEEAARCYLQTLSLNPSAIHCWSYLRIALSCSERWDLIPLAASQDLAAFRDHFDFVAHNPSGGST